MWMSEKSYLARNSSEYIGSRYKVIWFYAACSTQVGNHQVVARHTVPPKLSQGARVTADLTTALKAPQGQGIALKSSRTMEHHIHTTARKHAKETQETKCIHLYYNTYTLRSQVLVTHDIEPTL